MTQTRKTFCRNCASSCGMELTIDRNVVTQVRGDREHEITGGYVCIKGQSSAELHQGAEGRLTNSRKRLLSGDFENIDWSRAISEIAAKLRALIATHGPRSIALFNGTGSYTNTLGLPLALSWLDAIGSPNHFSSMTIDQSAKWVTQLRMGYFQSGVRHISEVDALLLTGNNPLVSHFGAATSNPTKAFRDAKERGAKIIVIDPRRTETARYADVHLQCLPGEDATICAGILNIILSNGWEDQEFCKRFVTNLEALRESVASYPPEYVSRRADVPAALLRQAAEIFANARYASAISGTGMCMAAHANLADHLNESLNAVCGAYRRAGDTVPACGAFFARTYTERAMPAFRSWEQGVKCRSADTGQLFGEFPTALLPDEILMPGPDKVRALIVLGGNPAIALGQPAKTVAAFRDLELLVTIDPRMTETALLSHYVIAPTLPFERHDVSTVGDIYFSRKFAQYAAPILSPPEGVIGETEFFWRLAREMHIQLTFKPMGLGMTFSTTSGGYPLDTETPPDPEQLIKRLCDVGSVPFDALKESPGGLLMNAPVDRVNSDPHSHARLDVCPSDIANELNQVRHETSADGAFRYRLIVRRQLETMNSAYRFAKGTLRRNETNPAFMCPQDMTDELLESGDRIEIESRYGRIVGFAKSDPALRRGVISMSHGWGVLDAAADPTGQHGGHTARLVSLEHDLDSITHMPRQTAIAVNIRKLNSGANIDKPPGRED